MLIFKLRCFELYNLQNYQQRVSLCIPPLNERGNLIKSSSSRAREMASDVLRATKQAMGHTHCLFRLAGVLVRDSVV